MDYSRKISERLWNMPDKGELESHREQPFWDFWHCYDSDPFVYGMGKDNLLALGKL